MLLGGLLFPGSGGIAQPRPATTIELEPVLHEGEICLNASWSYTGTEGVELFRFTRYRANSLTTDLRVLAAQTDPSTTIATPYTAPTVRDCLPGADGIEFAYALTLDLVGGAGRIAIQLAHRPMPPAAPSDLAYVPPTGEQRTGQLTWVAPLAGAPSGYLPLRGYDVEFRIGTSTIWHTAAPAHTGAATTYADPTAWTRGTVLHFRVRATNAAVQLRPTVPGAWGTVTVARTGPVPDPVTVMASMATVQVDSATFPPVRLAWADAATPVLGYHLYRFPAGDAMAPPSLGVAPLAAGLAPTVRSYEDASVSDPAAYEYRVQAYDVHGGGPLSAPARVTFVAPPPPPTAVPDTTVQLTGFAGGDVTGTLPAVLQAGELHSITVQPVAGTGTATPYRYGGGRRGFALDAGAHGWARWVTADRLEDCVDVALCALHPAGAAYGTHPVDGRASRWLAIWRGTSTRDGFDADTQLQLYVPPALPAARNVTFGFAQVPAAGGPPTWLDAPRTTVTVRPAGRIMDFTATPVAAGRARLTWTVAGGDPVGFQLQRRQADAGPETFATRCCDLAPTVRAWVETPPPSDPPGMAVEYEYRIGAYVAETLRWFPQRVRLTVPPDAPLTTAVAPSEQLHFPTWATTLAFATGAGVDQALPAAVGGVAPVTYTATAPRAVGLRVDATVTPARLRGIAWAGSAAGMLQATDANGATAQLAFRVVVGTPPAAPTGLTATGGTRQIALAWMPPADAPAVTGYRIEQATDGPERVWTVLVADTGTPAATHVHDGLAADRTVHYRVAAINASGPGAFSAPAQATTAVATPPSPPTAVRATPGSGEITLTWAPPTDDGGSPIVAYTIERSFVGVAGPWDELRDAQGDALRIDPASDISHIDNELWGERIAYYRVRAHNAHATPGVSPVVHGVPAPMRVPAAPVWKTSGSGISTGGALVRLTWWPVVESGDAPVEYYQVEHSPGGSTDSWSVLDFVRHTVIDGHVLDGSYTHTGIRNGATVQYRIAALSAAGLGPYSEVRSGSARVSTPANARFAAAHAGPDGITIEWVAPDDDGGLTINSYAIETSTDGRNWMDLVILPDGTARRHLHTAVPAGEVRHYRVRPGNPVGPASLWSNVARAVALNGEPTQASPPVLRPVVPETNQVCLDVTRDAAWMPAADRFRMEFSPSGYPDQWTAIADRTYAPDENTMALCLQDYRITVDGHTTEVAAGTTGHFRVRFGNSVGFGPPSTATTIRRPAIPANPPTDLTAVTRGLDVDLRWAPPLPEAGTDLTGYRIEQSTDDGGTWTTIVTDRPFVRPRHTVTGLTAMRTYRFRVAGSYANRPGAPTPPVTVTPALSEPPYPPRQLTATGGDRRIELHWAAPQTTRGATITGYRVERAGTPDAATWASVAVDGADTLTHTQDQIAPGVRLYFRVIARSDQGDSRPSAVVAARTDSTVPAAPAGLAAFPGPTAVLLEWDMPHDTGHRAIEGYRIEWRETEADPWADLVTHSGSTRTRFLHAGLTSGQTRQYRVAAINANGAGTASEHVTATTTGDRPGPPRQVTVTMRGDAAVLRWLPPTVGDAIVGYRVDRAPAGTTAWTTLATHTDTPATTHTDATAPPGDRVTYRVFAHNAAGPGRPAEYVTVTVMPAWPLAPTALRVTPDFFRNTLSWAAGPPGGGVAVTAYRIEQAPHADGPTWFPVATVPATTAPAYAHTGIPDGATVHYRIVARSATGESPPSVSTHSTLPPAATQLDVNGMDGFTVADALALYYSHTFDAVLGNGNSDSGYARLRRQLLAPNTSAAAIGDETLRAWVAAAHRVAQDHRQSRLDLNGDGNVDAADALLLYYAHEFRTALGDGRTATDGSAPLRCTLLGHLTVTGCVDETLRMLLREANDFWPSR